MALFHLTHSLRDCLNCKIVPTHLNHCIRGKEANDDERFVRRTVKELGHTAIVARRNVPALAIRKKISIEMAAREVRYEILAKTAAKFKNPIIATAHNANDLAETMILKLARGAGTRGLAGIRRSGTTDGIPLIRPLLDFTRDEIIAYLKSNNISWREDSTNLDTAYLRNRVRHKILPILEKHLSRQIISNMARTAEILTEEEEFLENAVKASFQKAVDGHVVKRNALSKLGRGISRRIVIEWLLQNGVANDIVNFDTVEKILGLADPLSSKKTCKLTKNLSAVISKDNITLAQTEATYRKAKPFRRKLCIPGTIAVPEAGCVVEAQFSKGFVRERVKLPCSLPATATISASAIGKSPIIIRSWEHGDIMRPLGMNGRSKKLQDIFVDARVPIEARSRVLVFECKGEIIWIPGYLIAHGWELPNTRASSIRLMTKTL